MRMGIRLAALAALFLSMAGGARSATGYAAAPVRPAAPSLATGHHIFGTIVLGGSISADNTLTMNGALAVGRPTDLTWQLPLPQTYEISGWQETVSEPQFTFSVPPDGWHDTTEFGNTLRVFHWSRPPADTVITVTEVLRVNTSSRLAPFTSRATLPLTGTFPAQASPYLAQTPNTALPADAVALVHSLTGGITTERAAVATVQNWIVSHLTYDASPSVKNDAASVFATRRASCAGYDDLMTGMLRELGIPVRVRFGWISARPLVFPGPQKSRATLQWSVPGTQGEFHAWLNVYFPDAGWVPFDPQQEEFFIDPRHIAFFSNPDALSLVDEHGKPWFGAAVGTYDAGNDPLFGTLPSGGTMIVPGSSSASDVTVTTVDHGKARYRAFQQASKRLLLFAR